MKVDVTSSNARPTMATSTTTFWMWFLAQVTFAFSSRKRKSGESCRIARPRRSLTQRMQGFSLLLIMQCGLMSLLGNVSVSEAFTVSIGIIEGYKAIREVSCPVQAALHEEKDVMYYSKINTSFDAIQYMIQDSSGHFYGFHETNATSEPLNVKGIMKLEEAVGDPAKLTVIVCVPEANFEAFTLNPGNPQADGARCHIFIAMIVPWTLV